MPQKRTLKMVLGNPLSAETRDQDRVEENAILKNVKRL